MPPCCVADHVCLATHRHHTWPPPYPQHTYRLRQVKPSLSPRVRRDDTRPHTHTHTRRDDEKGTSASPWPRLYPIMARLDPSCACAKGPSRPRLIAGSGTRHGGHSKHRIMPTHTGLVTSAQGQQRDTCDLPQRHYTLPPSTHEWSPAEARDASRPALCFEPHLSPSLLRRRPHREAVGPMCTSRRPVRWRALPSRNQPLDVDCHHHVPRGCLRRYSQQS
jgi:hypothetical protein